METSQDSFTVTRVKKMIMNHSRSVNKESVNTVENTGDKCRWASSVKNSAPHG
jgi:hypothetical protein